jgi:selenocysteine lyase/cysteine desulfurase
MERSMIMVGRSLVWPRVEELRAQFPVLERFAYLNAGTNGPVPRRAFEAAEAALREQLEQGRSSRLWFARQVERIDELRGRVAGLLTANEADVALTGSTTDGINAVLHALQLNRGDEILTSDEEHPGVLAPLATARDTRGVNVREVPFDELPGAVGPETRVVVTSHVSWATGRVMDTAPLAASDARVVLDGAQGLGAVPVDVGALGCDFYAASGQKWLCGPGGMGYLYANPKLVPDLPAPWSGYHALEYAERALLPALQPDARRLTTGFPVPHHVEWSHAALDVLEEAGFDTVHEAAIQRAERFAERLRERGVDVAPRGTCTLVSFAVPDPEAFTQEAATEGLVIRFLPGRPWARASVGAWNTDEELDQLADLAAAAAVSRR